MKKSTSLTLLQINAAVVALCVVAQAVLGAIMAFGDASFGQTHRIIAMVTMLVAIIAAVAAFLWKRESDNTGLFGHAVGVAVLAVAQFGLGEMHAMTAHYVIGVALLLAGVALATLAYRKPEGSAPLA